MPVEQAPAQNQPDRTHPDSPKCITLVLRVPDGVSPDEILAEIGKQAAELPPGYLRRMTLGPDPDQALYAAAPIDDRKARRERIAVDALPGVLAGNRFGADLTSAAWEAVNAADALIAILDATKPATEGGAR